jgi:hypothetical protein
MPSTVTLLEPFQELFHLFEEEFYPGVFPGCVLGLIPISPATISYFHAEKFQDDEGQVYHEIVINRVYLGKLPRDYFRRPTFAGNGPFKDLSPGDGEPKKLYHSICRK